MFQEFQYTSQLGLPGFKYIDLIPYSRSLKENVKIQDPTNYLERGRKGDLGGIDLR